MLDATTPGGTYQWQDGTTESTYSVSATGTYFVAVTVDNCGGGDTIFVEAADCEVVLTMPNIITPNGDGENDIFQPILLSGHAEIEMKIVNRWGGEVYSTSNPKVEWPGTTNNGDDVPEGVYFWVANIKGNDGNSYEFSGNVTVVR
jgi:gliding motility-associated-like protein